MAKRKRRVVKPDLLGPTPERLAKPDAPEKSATTGYRVKPLIEKLRDKPWLDRSPYVRHTMHAAAEQLQRLYAISGLSGAIGSINIDAIAALSAEPAYLMPRSQAAAEARIEFRAACREMGFYADRPLHGCARVVVALICEETSFEDATRYVPYGSTEERRGMVKDRLRNGLTALVGRWRIEGPRSRISAAW